MLQAMTLEYWTEENWFIGRLREIPGVFSQAESLAELEDNIRDAYELLRADEAASHLIPLGALSKPIQVKV